MAEYAIESDFEVKGGPIWTQVKVVAKDDGRFENPEITNEDVIEVENVVWGAIEEKRDPMTGPEDRPDEPINFVNDITQRDLYCFKERDRFASCFIRHREDFMSVKVLWGFTKFLQGEVERILSGRLVLRSVDVVATTWVEQHHPEIVENK